MNDRRPPALKVMVNGKMREISYEELTLSNNLAQEALVRLLIKKNMIDPKEYVEMMNIVKDERYKTLDPNQQQAGTEEDNG
jgi:uncharacterized LabA/DUF88 family protein